MGPSPPTGGPASKQAARAAARSARRALSLDARAAAAEQLLARLLALPAVAGADVVAAYVPGGSEPGSVRLLDELRDRGARVLLPVLLPDGDLDWAEYAGSAALVAGARATREPAGPRLGRAAVCSAGVVVVPALAVDQQGHRLGRGGGSYDRVLARLPAGVPVVALLYDGELVESLPVEEHDRPVDVVVMPGGVHRLPA